MCACVRDNKAYSGRNVAVQHCILISTGSSLCFKVMDFFIGISCGNVQALVHRVRRDQCMGLQLDSATIVRGGVVSCTINYRVQATQGAEACEVTT